MSRGGPDDWRVEEYLPHARNLLTERNYYSTKQLGKALRLSGAMAAAVFRKLGWRKYSRTGGGKAGVVYERGDEY